MTTSETAIGQGEPASSFRTARRAGWLALALILTPAAAPAQTPAEPPGLSDCKVCHGWTKDGPPTMGPSLWGLAGRKAGATDFPYSPAMRSAGVTWTSATLEKFLMQPQQAIPGNAMMFPGIADQRTAKEVADYLMTRHD